MRELLLNVFFFLTLTCFAQSKAGQFVIEKQETENLLRILSSDKANGRATNSTGFDKSAKFVEVYLLSHNVYPLIGTKYRDELKYSDFKGENILARVGDFRFGRKTIVLGAHLDHIGKIRGKVYNGANDNATGCVALMQIAAYLAQYEYDVNIAIAFFAGEENGLLGSKDFARKLSSLGFKPDYMINFEMLGVPLDYGNEHQVYLSGYEMSNMAEELNQAAGFEFITFFKKEYKHAIFHRSDNFPFYESFEIPAHTIIAYTVDNYKYYHQHTDEFDKIDIDYLHRVTETSAKAIQTILANNTEFKLVERHQKISDKNNLYPPVPRGAKGP